MQIARQIKHWNLAAQRLADLDDLASPEAWRGLEQYLGLALRRNLSLVVGGLSRRGGVLEAQLAAAQSPQEWEQLAQDLVAFRRDYKRAETTLDFFGDAVSTRTNPKIAAILRTCDFLSMQSMTRLLEHLGKTPPPVLTYIDKGLGASILKAGLRLWDQRTLSAVAGIKVVRHNIFRTTALIHESGHQIAHMIGWNEELGNALLQGVSRESRELASTWASWASEIAADAFAFVHTGYAAVAALHDVLAGGQKFVLRHRIGDPHPISYLRVLLGVAMCDTFYGDGPWRNLAAAWIRINPLAAATAETRGIVEASQPLLPRITEIILKTPMQGMRGRSIAELIDPMRVSPKALIELERSAGVSLYTSHHWYASEGLRIVALNGFRVATNPARFEELTQYQRNWMINQNAAALAA